MDIQEFTKNLEAEFEDVTPGSISPDTAFRSIKGWSSMHALIIIAFVDTNYNVLLNGTDIKSAQTIRDLYDLTIEKSN